MKRVISIASARPNFVKLAAVHHALAARPQEFEHIIMHTGQHYDPLLSDIFFKQLQIPEPKQNLGVKGSDREAVISRTEEALIPVLTEEKPDIVLVYGDVNGALGGARAAKKLNIQLAHVEAGLRSGDLEMPEEHNRIAIDQLADILFCTEQAGVDHVKAEHVKGRIELVGNTMIDTLQRTKPIWTKLSKEIEEKQRPKLEQKKFAMATIHRPSNVDDPATLKRVVQFLQQVSQHCPVTLAAHPRFQLAVQSIDFSDSEDDSPLLFTQPMDYFSFIALMKASACIITDSGGIQEEAVLLGKRCFTLRKNTERPSTIHSGSNVLIDSDTAADRENVFDFAKNPHDPDITIPEFWDGKAGERIVDILAHL